MGNYRNEVENTADYLGHRIPMFNELMDVKGVPEYVDIPTHLRMMYGHTDWNDHVVRLTPEMMSQLREKKDRIDVGRKVLPRMYAGMTVALLNNETWRKTWTTVLFYVGIKVMNQAIEADKRKTGPSFELEQKEVDRYLEDAGF